MIGLYRGFTELTLHLARRKRIGDGRGRNVEQAHVEFLESAEAASKAGQTARKSLCGRIAHHTADRCNARGRHDMTTTVNDLNTVSREWMHRCPTPAARKFNEP